MSADFYLKYSVQDIKRYHREQEAIAKMANVALPPDVDYKHRDVQNKINDVLEVIKKKGSFFAIVNKFDSDVLSGAYDFLKKKGFKASWEHSEITISV